MYIELNKKQMEAFKALEKAFKKCETAKITFYAVIGNLTALNGNYIKGVETDTFAPYDATPLRDIVEIGLSPSVEYPCEMADDECGHYAILTERGLKKLAKEREEEE